MLGDSHANRQHPRSQNPSRLVDEAVKGEEILIARADKPIAIARLVALTPTDRKPPTLGQWKDKFTLPKDSPNLHDEAIQRMFEGDA